jgi:hypothetical protein
VSNSSSIVEVDNDDDDDEEFFDTKKNALSVKRKAPESAASPAAFSTKSAKTVSGGPGKKAGESLKFKSPAEFFAENQNIAGFDNVRVVATSKCRFYCMSC